MLRSLYSGVSGLQNHQTRMDVVGNNISNVNTIGFKKGRVNFKDLISQSQQGASAPNERIGGVNPQQVGLGVAISTIDTIHTQGALQNTGIKTDLAIQGDGFFILKNGAKQYYTRSGAFGVDSEGTLVNPSNGFKVAGWQAVKNEQGEPVINNSGAIGDIRIPIGQKDDAKSTSEVNVASNLNKNTPIVGDPNNAQQTRDGSWVVSYPIFDEFGNTHNLQITYTKVQNNGQETPNQWNAAVAIIDPITGQPIEGTAVNVGGQDNGGGDTNVAVTFANDGTLASVGNAAGGASNQGMLSASITFPVPNSAPDADGNPQTQTFNLVFGTVGSTEDSTTQFASDSSNKVYKQNGNGMGYLTDFRIDNSGTITGVYSNGKTKSIGQIGMASFTNPAGLEKSGETNFVETNNSGIANISPSGIAGKGTMQAGVLEMSNVDLAEQFTDMIVAQRGFQASGKTISTSDQILQELLQLKR